MPTTSPVVHRDAASAWAHLVNCGGLELTGRDEGLELELQGRLDPQAPSLAEALAHVPLDRFLLALFEVASPYFRMYESILEFFETSGATRGRQDWCLALEGGDLPLQHFKTQLATWHSLAGSVPVPALDSDAAWQVRKIFVSSGAVDEALSVKDLVWPRWLSDWIQALDRGEFWPLCEESLKADLPREFHPILGFIVGMAYRLASSQRSRPELQRALVQRHHRVRRGDALDLWTAVQLDHDHYLRNRLRDLYAARASTVAQRKAIEKGLEALIAPFPLRHLAMSISVPEFEALLRLPLWQQRSELYAVWIATEIVRGLDQHAVKLHHDHGRLEFAFREMALATVLTSAPPITLFGERRSPLALNSSSTTRTEGVQPDYALWKSTLSEVSNCCLVVECKHYKQSAGRKFTEVLTDYALSLPSAQIYLVNYGPIGDVCEPLSRPLQRRCSTLAHYLPGNSDAEKALRAAVRTAVGPPTVSLDASAKASAGGEVAMIVDISPSMEVFLAAPDWAPNVQTLIAECGVQVLFTVDEQIRDIQMPTPEAIECVRLQRGSGTALLQPVSTIVSRYERVLVLTDEDGMKTLGSLSFISRPSWQGTLYVLDLKE